MLVAVFQNRVQKALCLARARARCNQRGAPVIARQPLECPLLVDVRLVRRVDGLKEAHWHILGYAKRKAHSDKGPMENRVLGGK